MSTKIQRDISLTLLRSATVLDQYNSPDCPCSFVSIELEKDNSDSSAKKWSDGARCCILRLDVKPNQTFVATVKFPKEACEVASKNTGEIKIKLII